MIVMGLDVSVRATGIAVIGIKPETLIDGRPAGNPWYVERAGYSLGTDASFDEMHSRLAYITRRVHNLAKVVHPDLVAIEDVVFANEGSAKAQIWGANLLVQHAAWRLSIPVKMVQLSEWRAWYGVAVQTIKKRNPEASKYEISRLLKTQVRDRVRERFGVDFEASEHNEAEAFAIAHYARHRALNPDAVQRDLGVVATTTKRKR